MGNLINVDELEMGMILGEDVTNKNTGVVLIAQEMRITKTLIERLINYDIREVFIKRERIPKEKYNEPLMSRYSKIEEKLDTVFTDVKEGKGLSSKEILKNMEEFVEEIVNERDILTQLRLLRNANDYTFNHSIAVSTLAASLGKWLGYTEKEIKDLGIAGLFHDLGKLEIPQDILNKPGKLTEEEFEIMKNHSLYSSRILIENGSFNEDIISGVLQHHERMDGSGYPDKIKGNKIHKYGRVIAICDVYHALTTRRVYKDKENPLYVAEYIRKEGFSKLDPHMTQVFLNNISKFYVGNKVILSTGEIGEIIYIHPQEGTKPIVKVGNKFIDFLKEKEIKVVDVVI